MYDLLTAGRLGNVVPQFGDCSRWLHDPGGYASAEWWGVRSKVAGGPCFLNTRREGVLRRCLEITDAGYAYNISVMIDRILTVTLWGEVWDSPTGLVVYGIEHPPPGGSWRELMPSGGRHWTGVAAHALLRRHMNPNSYDDWREFRDIYPGHVYEFSACESEYGTVPGRNCVVWEVRAY